MSNITKKNVRKLQQYAGPSGNAWKDVFRFQTNSSGVFVDSDTATAVQAADVVRLGVLPAGLELHDALAIVSDAFTATATATIGFAYVDGVDDSNVPQDADYFFAALAYNAVGRTRATNTGVAPVVLPKDAYLTLTNNTAALAAVGIIDIVVEGIHKGNP